MSTVALVLHHERPEARSLAGEVVRWLAARDHEVRLPRQDADIIDRSDLGVDEAVIADGCDLAVSLGGDGTMLRTVDLVAAKGVAVLGVNVGQLGYLTDVEPAELLDALERVFNGRHRIEERMLLDVRVSDGAQTLALNECVVERTPTGRTVRLRVLLNDEFFTNYAADGVIVATPTGSTAYSFSARGPIVDPVYRAMVVTPVSPHMLFDRSMVLAPDATVRLELDHDRPAIVSVDGRHLAELAEGQWVSCTAASQPARLVRCSDHNFHRILKAKFGLADR